MLVSFCDLVVATITIFFVNHDSFRPGTKPNQLPQFDRSEGIEHRCSNQKIHNVANSDGSFSSLEEAYVILFRPKLPERRGVAAGG